MTRWPRIIALIDMAAFFASVEQMDRPEWRGRPIGVTNGERGTCIITSSYEARAFGVKTGMRVKEAKQLCPGFIQVASRPARYTEVSSAIMRALEDITPDIEIFSVDEAFLDLTHCQSYYNTTAEQIGRLIKQTVFDASGLRCAVGISGDKTTAKWAAKREKVGLTVVPPWDAEATLANEPVTELCGISDGIGAFLKARGVERCGDMKRIPISAVAQRFGNPGRRLWLMAQGRDPEPVQQETAPAKSLGHGKVIAPDTRDRELLLMYYMHMAEKVGRRLRKNDLEAQTFAISLRTDLGGIGAKYRTVAATDDGAAIYALAKSFIDTRWGGQGGFQVQINALDPRPAAQQGDLFATDSTAADGLNATVDAINEKFGAFAVHRAPLVRRTDMPNVISPGWRPSGHRESIDY